MTHTCNHWVAGWCYHPENTGRKACPGYKNCNMTSKDTRVPVETDLKKIIDDILWMAIIYAHGRHTYEPHTVREAVLKMKELYPGYTVRINETLGKRPENAFFPGDYLNDLLPEVRNEKNRHKMDPDFFWKTN